MLEEFFEAALRLLVLLFFFSELLLIFIGAIIYLGCRTVPQLCRQLIVLGCQLFIPIGDFVIRFQVHVHLTGQTFLPTLTLLYLLSLLLYCTLQ